VWHTLDGKETWKSYTEHFEVDTEGERGTFSLFWCTSVVVYSPAEEEIRLRAYFRPAAGDMNLTKQI
jgi:hypothetical protein